MSFPPKIVKPYVISFCRAVVAQPEPRYVPLEPLENAEPDSCFETVPAHLEKNGGTMSIGWAIWEWPNVIIEAEFHAIWITPEGREVDITPKKIPQKRILFLPDDRRKYEGFQRDNIRKSLCRDKDIDRLIVLSKKIHEEMNRGDLKFYHGPVAMGDSYMRLVSEKDSIERRMASRYGHYLEASLRHLS